MPNENQLYEDIKKLNALYEELCWGHNDELLDNLLGEDMGKLPELLASAGTHVHLYGKAEAREGRKMGHVTRVSGSRG